MYKNNKIKNTISNINTIIMNVTKQLRNYGTAKM